MENLNAQLASHEDILRYLVAICVRMDTVIIELANIQKLVVQLLHRREGDTNVNG